MRFRFWRFHGLARFGFVCLFRRSRHNGIGVWLGYDTSNFVAYEAGVHPTLGMCGGTGRSHLD
jgi:hypothetical protein